MELSVYFDAHIYSVAEGLLFCETLSVHSLEGKGINLFVCP